MDTFLSQPTTHNHAPNPDRIPVVQLHNEVKQRAATTDESTSSILISALRTFPLRAAGELPRNDIMIQTIRREQSKFEIDIVQILQGHQPKPKKASYRELDERIARLVLGYDQSQIDQYLKNISPNISL